MSEVKVIGIGNDHAAVDLKNEIKAYLEEKGYKVVNYGTDSSESCDYPVYGAKVGNAVASGEVDAGVLICGTGIGISIAANKVNGVRAAVVSEPVSARLTKRTQQCKHHCIRCKNRWKRNGKSNRRCMA